MVTHDIPQTVPPVRDADAPMSYGRSDSINDAVRLLVARQDVVVEAEDGLGRTATVRAIEHALRLQFWRVVDVSELAISDAAMGPVAVTVDLDNLTQEHATKLAEVQRYSHIRLLMMRRTPHPFEQTTHSWVASIDRAEVMRLLPLTEDQTNALIDEQLLRTSMRAEPGIADRIWVHATSAGFPELAVALLHDADEASEEEGSLSRLGRQSIVAASAIVAGLPEPLQDLARSLLPLAGVKFSRLARTFDRVELSLLVGSHVVQEVNDTLIVPQPIQAALRLLPMRADRRGQVGEVIADICASLTIDGDCTEAEVFAATAAIGSDAEIRAGIPSASYLAVLITGMWLSRRRGDSANAAALARRMMTNFPESFAGAVRSVARAEPDDFETFGNRLRARSEQVPPPGIWVWILCAQIPYLHSTPGATELIELASMQAQQMQLKQFADLRAVVSATADFADGSPETAMASIAPIITDPGAHCSVKLRALMLKAAIAAAALDHEAMREVDYVFLDVVRSMQRGKDLNQDLALRDALDAIVIIGLCFAAAGLPRIEGVTELTKRLLTEALVIGDTSSVSPLVLNLVLDASQKYELETVTSLVRFLHKKRHTDLSRWALAQMDGETVVAPTHIVGSRFVKYAISASRLLSSGIVLGVEEFSSALDELPRGMGPLATICHAFVHRDAQAFSAPDLARVVDRLEKDSIIGAMTLAVLGERDSDPVLLLDAAGYLASVGAGFHSKRLLDDIEQLGGPSAEEESRFRVIQRQVAARMRAAENPQLALTKRERQVALLAAQGLKNREIARRLYLSVRTVESHMYRALRKLAVTREGIQVATLMRQENE